MKEEPTINPEKKKKGKFEEWEVSNAVDTLMRAEEIKQDAALMAEVKKAMKKKVRAIRSIADLREAAKEVEDDED